MEWQVSLNNTSFDRAGITKDCKEAICEYIWNGFEAGATKVIVKIDGQPLSEAMSIKVIDNGSGIQYDNLNATFGAFLSSIKNNASIRIKSQANKGKGRFSYLCFSSSAEWTSIFEQDGVLKKFTINMDSSNRSQFGTTTPVYDANAESTGTTVEFPLLESSVNEDLSLTNIRQKLLEEFAWYLYLNKRKGVSLEYLGSVLDVSQYINTELSSNNIERIGCENFDINVIVWRNNVANASKIFYLTENGEIVSVQNTSFNKNTVGFFHAVFVSSKYFKPDMFISAEMESEQVELETQNDQQSVMRELKKRISTLVSEALKGFLVLQADKHLAEMGKRGTLPWFSQDEYGQLRKKDFETVAKELYCVEPKIFFKLNDKQERSLLGFLNLLLSSEERENVLQIVEQVVNLTPEQRKNFADILQRSKLQYIIEAINVIEKRISVVEELKKIVFDMTEFANEREHIQKIVEQHFWLFGEQYHLLTADKNLMTSLQEFEKITNVPLPTEMSSLTPKEISQRIDVFLYSKRVQEDSQSEMLVVELKAPYVKLSLDVYNQVVRYANTIRREPRFNGGNRIWRFFAVCSEVDDDVKTKYSNFAQYGRNGLVDIIGNFEIYALSWDDIFQSFEARHSFLLEHLKLDYSQVTTALGNENNLPISRATVNELSKKLLAINA
jgi:hypothetical protein